jgi:gas vesicle protein
MPRVNAVKKARKPQGKCGRCGTEINVGDAYLWIKLRYGGKRIRCTDFACRFRPSDLTGGKMSGVYAAQENAEDSIGDMDSVEDIKNLAEETADSIQEVADEYQESADAISEHFEGSSTAEECEEQAQNLGDWAETIRDSVSDFSDEFEPTNGFNADGDRVCPECGGEVEEDGEYFICCDVIGCGAHGDLEDDEPRDDEGRTREEWVEAARDALNDALSECPC